MLLVALAAITGITLVVWLWRNHAQLWRSLSALPVPGRVAVVVAGAVFVMAAAWGTAEGWTYTQHDNDFCVSCHVMGDAWTRFQESEHRTLSCHDCHQQSVFASLRQVYVWVAERPEEIGPHAKVPTRVCQNCHNQERPDSTWQRVMATAGHSVHLRSDSAALGDVQCVTCHGADVHRFVPVDRTCGQSGCHDDIEMRLGNMAGQTALHCTGCHNFTLPVSESAPLDSARGRMIPSRPECLACHAMREQLQHTMRELDPAVEPHGAVCGSCHNPHVQESPAAAFESCGQADCHARADTLTAFHRSVRTHMLDACGTCHKAHSWQARAAQCLDCHKDAANPVRPQRLP
jgi:nitrate/TMAO reductase-like tetraheme cytochrome c subunit